MVILTRLTNIPFIESLTELDSLSELLDYIYDYDPSVNLMKLEGEM